MTPADPAHGQPNADASATTIRFDDPAAYEAMMGRWSLIAGERFLDWLGPLPTAARWLDVGCGNGAFTECFVRRCAPAGVLAVDPSPAQLDYARRRLPTTGACRVDWVEGEAMHLPAADAAFDVAVMALVLFFVPQPAVGVAEMVRAVRPGGTVAAYHWDILGGGFPLADAHDAARAIGLVPRLPPSVAAAGREASADVWRAAGLEQVRTERLPVQRRFDSFADYWSTAASSNTLSAIFNGLPAEQILALKEDTRRRLGAGNGPGVTVSACANAVTGTKPL